MVRVVTTLGVCACVVLVMVCASCLKICCCFHCVVMVVVTVFCGFSDSLTSSLRLEKGGGQNGHYSGCLVVCRVSNGFCVLSRVVLKFVVFIAFSWCLGWFSWF